VTAREGFAASDEQYRLWDAAGECCRGWLGVAIEVHGAIPTSALAETLTRLVADHEVLRTRLVRHRALHMPLQVIDPPFEVALERTEHGPPRAAAAGFAAAAAAAGSAPLRAALASGRDSALLLLAIPSASADRRTGELLVAAIAAALNGGPAEDRVQFADYVEWLRQARRRDDGAGATWWSARLRDADHAGAAELEAGAGRATVRAPIGAGLRALAAAWGCATGDVFATVCQLWWSRRTGEPRSIDIALDGRNHARLAGALGPYTIRVPLAIAIGDDMPLRAAVELHRTALAEMARHLDSVPGPETRRVCGRPVMRPLVEVGAEDRSTAARDATLWLRAVHVANPIDPLRVALIERPEDDVLELDHDRAQLDDEDAARAVEQLATLIEAAVRRPDAPCGELPVVGPRERAMITALGHGPVLDAHEPSVIERLAAAARRMPDAPAVVDGERTLSFTQLDRRANQLAARLARLGIGRGDRIALCIGRSADAVAAAFGILRAGAAYVPIDPDTLNPGHTGLPRRRLAYMLEDSRARAVVIGRDLAGALPSDAPARVEIDPSWDTVASESGEAPGIHVEPRDIAYCIYTSGSTGRPKAVMVEHGAVQNLAAALRSTVYPPDGRPRRITLNAPMGFDPSVQQLAMLPDGHALHVVPHEVRAHGRAFSEWLRRHAIDILDCTPPQLRLLLDAGLFGAAGAPERVLCGGEAIDPALWRALASVPGTRVFNLYGPTECTVDSTCAELTDPHAPPTIGRPLPNVGVYVLDHRQQPVPLGGCGELCIAGPGVARGYLGRPELEAGRFVRHELAGDGMLYRTGDRARMLRDGRLMFLGRFDHQVKLRSHRIELGEVEATIAQVPGVAAAAVSVREDRPGERRLVGYVAGAPRREELRAHLTSWLPEYMVPTSFVFLDQLPLTPNGKVDRAALPPPRRTRPALATPLVLPRTRLEELVAGVWRETLDIEPIGVDDDFFELGGDSLLAVALFSQLERLAGRELDVDVFAGPHTIAHHASGVGVAA
jgi:amino acid adenylation domain-containing protein